MNASFFWRKGTLTCFAVLALCGALTAPAGATDRTVTVRIVVNSAGLDLTKPEVVRELYRRVAFAADIACGKGNRVGLEPVPHFQACYEGSLAAAVRAANLPPLTAAYLAHHRALDAAAYGITPVLTAAR
jgi:UrcA family protein